MIVATVNVRHSNDGMADRPDTSVSWSLRVREVSEANSYEQPRPFDPFCAQHSSDVHATTYNVLA